jgi:hypothetical protein
LQFRRPQLQTITGVEYDSRRVRPGSVFVAMKGGSTDGNRYVDKAIAAGALGIITDSAPTFDHLLVYSPACPSSKSSTAAARWPGLRRLLRPSGAQARGHRHHRHQRQNHHGLSDRALLNAAARKTVLVGTIEYHVAGEVRPSVHTTPESRDLFELMAEGVARGATELVTEVSSHGLDQGRAAAVNFDVAVFTNLTRDHLDYHQTMEKYFAAKRLLFDGTVYPAPRVAVINAHDPRARRSWPPPRARPAQRSAPTASAKATGAPRAIRSRPPARLDLETPAGRPKCFAPRRRSEHPQPAGRLHRRPRARRALRRSGRVRFPTSSPFPAAFNPSMPASPSR